MKPTVEENECMVRTDSSDAMPTEQCNLTVTYNFIQFIPEFNIKAMQMGKGVPLLLYKREACKN